MGKKKKKKKKKFFFWGVFFKGKGGYWCVTCGNAQTAEEKEKRQKGNLEHGKHSCDTVVFGKGLPPSRQGWKKGGGGVRLKNNYELNEKKKTVL